jgi:hypothetical protein
MKGATRYDAGSSYADDSKVSWFQLQYFRWLGVVGGYYLVILAKDLLWISRNGGLAVHNLANLMRLHMRTEDLIIMLFVLLVMRPPIPYSHRE